MEIIVPLSLILMTMSLLWFPQWHVFGKRWQSYWIIALLGALLTWIASGMNVMFLFEAWSGDGAMNPLRILSLFFAFTVLAIFLDEVVFIKYLAYLALSKAGTSQPKLFLVWY